MGILDQAASSGSIPPWLAAMLGQAQGAQPPQPQGVMGGAPAPPQQPPQPQPSALSAASPFFSALGQGLGNNSSALMAFGGGTLSGGIGKGFTAAAAAGDEDRKRRMEDQQNSALKATYDALLARGVPAAQATAMAQNPEYMNKNLLGVQPQQHVTTTDMLGNQALQSFDPATGKYRGQDGKPMAAPAAGSDTGPLPTGQEYLDKYVPKELHNEIKQIASGDQPASGLRNLQKLIPLVANYDPSFNASNYPTMLATRKSYTSGKDFQETQALNTVAGHMGRLMDSAEGLNNGGFKPLNWIENNLKDYTVGSPPLVKFRNDLVTTQNELAKAYHGGHVSDSAYNAFSKSIGESQTPAELKTAIGELGGLLQSKIEAKESGYRASMGKAPIPAEFKAMNDEALQSFQRINDWASGTNKAGTPTAAAPAAKIQPGSYVWDGGTNIRAMSR